MESIKQKILVTTSSYPKYKGNHEGSFVHELALRLTDEFDVYVLAPFSVGSLKKEVIDNVKITRYKYWFGKSLLSDGVIMANLRKNKLYYFQVLPFLFFQLINIIRIVQKEKINIIHAHWFVPQALIAVIYKIVFNKKIKIIATAHGSDINTFNKSFGRKILKFIINNINSLTVVSNAIKDIIKPYSKNKEVSVYPMGIDTNKFSPDKKDDNIKKGFNIKGKFILYVGAIIETKGIRHLIEAMPKILEFKNDTKLILIGDGNLKQEMIELTKKLNIENNVIFTGAKPHDELPPYFATADLFVLPSYSEGFGLVAAEALSSGTIALSSNLKPINDIIKENITGFYLNEISKSEISNKIIHILNNIEKHKEIEVNGRKHIVNNFDWEIVAKNYKYIIKKLINE